MTCSHCSAEIAEGTHFCLSCGKPAQPVPAPQVPTPPLPPGGLRPPPRPEGDHIPLGGAPLPCPPPPKQDKKGVLGRLIDRLTGGDD